MNNIVRTIALISAVLLLLCFLDLPYGYYMFLRIVIFISSLIFVYYSYSTEKTGLAILFGLTAILWNPIIKISFEKETWLIFDVIAAVIFISAYFLSKKQPPKES